MDDTSKSSADTTDPNQDEDQAEQRFSEMLEAFQNSTAKEFPDQLKNVRAFEVQVGINHALPNPISLDPNDWLNSEYEEGRFYVQPTRVAYKTAVTEDEEFETRYELIQWMNRYIRKAVQDFNLSNTPRFHCVQRMPAKWLLTKDSKDD